MTLHSATPANDPVAPDQPVLRYGDAEAGLNKNVAGLFAVACGLAVANAYYAQPLLDTLADEFSIDRSAIGVVITATQVGYGIGLILLVPLGDVLNRRRLIVAQSLLSAVALLVVSYAPNAIVLLGGMGAVGFLAVVTQTLVAYASILARPAERGQTVGVVTSGVIIGILLARTVSGTLSDVFGWRSVYLVSAAATLVVCALLYKALPVHEASKARVSYPRLIWSVFILFVEEPLLRTRAFIGLLIFGVVNMLWTPMVFPLSSAPFFLSHTQVGLFGLAGAMGALGASSAGRLADSGHAQRSTGIALALMLVAWLPISLLSTSIWFLIAGVLIIDFALQAAHVSNQTLIFRVKPEARSRLTAAYMVFYSIGCAIGSIGSTLIYAYGGWASVCATAAFFSAVALVFWWTTRHVGQSDNT
ncbi:MAG: MFS transporter [Chthoniobacterales bacterium]|nr:MFS transporter [Chthoniobacterales bacterium]